MKKLVCHLKSLEATIKKFKIRSRSIKSLSILFCIFKFKKNILFLNFGCHFECPNPRLQLSKVSILFCYIDEDSLSDLLVI